MDLIITILPVVTKDLPISPRFTPSDFLSRCKSSTLTTRQPMVEFYFKGNIKLNPLCKNTEVYCCTPMYRFITCRMASDSTSTLQAHKQDDDRHVDLCFLRTIRTCPYGGRQAHLTLTSRHIRSPHHLQSQQQL